jgi:leucyl aminopeptidase
MNFELQACAMARVGEKSEDALLLVVSSKFEAKADPLSLLVKAWLDSGELEGQPGKWVQTHRPQGTNVTRLVVVHAGEASDKNLRQAVSTGIRLLKSSPLIKSARLHLSCETSLAKLPIAILAAADASYVYTTTHSKPEGRKIKKLTISGYRAARYVQEFDRAVATVRGIELAKEWGNRPANHASPTHLAEAAKGIAKSKSVSCKVFDEKQIQKLGMESFLAVSRGSVLAPRFIVLQYRGDVSSRAPIVLIGKGITFDTGGISLKPAAEMDEMKFDMCGAASVLGVFRTLADVAPKLNVVGLIPTCENMPGGNALKPGDVVTSMSGQTIEVLNTDAEGRLILCDALTYAERFNPVSVIDIATLTGACVIALGAVRSGMFSNNDVLAAQLTAAGESAMDPCWRMPLDDEYAEGLKTNFADVANVAGRAGGAVTAAKFLQRFAGKFPWAHLDIAGTAWAQGSAKGSTGRPVGMLVQFLLNQASVPLRASYPVNPNDQAVLLK